MKIYIFRHQAAGYMHGFPFAQEPTPEQIAPLLAMCEIAHGKTHKGQPLWHRVESFDVLGPTDLPAAPSVQDSQPIPGPTGSGTCVVT